MRQSIVAVCIVTALAGCGHKEAATGPSPVAVSTDTVNRGTISTYATFDGEITPIFQTTLSTAETGIIQSVDVSERDFVKAGQILATLDTAQLQATLAANEAQVRQGEAQVEHSVIAAPIASIVRKRSTLLTMPFTSILRAVGLPTSQAHRHNRHASTSGSTFRTR